MWDVFCRDGEEFLFRTALGILRLYEDILTHMDFIHIAQFLTRLPDYISAEEIFSSITTINMNSKNKKWPQVHIFLKQSHVNASHTCVYLLSKCKGVLTPAFFIYSLFFIIKLKLIIPFSVDSIRTLVHTK